LSKMPCFSLILPPYSYLIELMIDLIHM
jgi:hypothetical protein